ncbi:MAG: hypothetical protein L3J41_09680 [Melioribacteraceae bacterium]|nr:hypothetical protein [Melioribacteraceae bacterium]
MKKLFTILLLFSLVQATTFAQFSTSSAFGVRYLVPSGTTSDIYDNGFGITGTSNFSVLPILDITFEGSWHTLKSKELSIDGSGNIIEDGDLSILGFVAGPVLTLGLVDVGIKGGYFFDDLHEWVLFPFAQVDIFMFSLGAEYKAVGGTKWAALYLNLNF